MTEKMQPFDLLNHPLSGTTLIEANAGTGKTYAITGLFLRLILERGLAVDEVLVVTFTEAATAELKDRIRRTLREALDDPAPGQHRDSFIADLLARLPKTEQAAGRLREALYGFDRAAIFTIHGFCRRVLHDQAFESSALFDTELILDQAEIKREVIHDFWRRHFYRASPFFVQYVLQSGMDPESFSRLARERLIQPFLKIIPQGDRIDTGPEEKAFLNALAQVRDSWPGSQGQVRELLLNSEGLNKNQYRPDQVPLWLRSMAAFLAQARLHPFLFKAFAKFTRSSLIKATRKNGSTPVHSFFDHCQALADKQADLIRAFERRLLGLQSGLLQSLRPELARRKQEKNLQSFDDLLQKVQQALQGRGAGLLGNALRARFKAALIDEFQDTDQVQYDIFRQIFNSQAFPLFLIGDPKQAIYGFRGADLFTYLAAAKEVQGRYTLQENWRSQPGLIRAVNALFKNSENPFVYEAIQYQPSIPARERNGKDKETGQADDPALRIWFMDSRKYLDHKPIPKGRARKWINRAVAAEISRLLQEPEKRETPAGAEKISPEEIAVLVRRNLEARRIQEALHALGIPSVLYSSGNLFESPEAREAEQVLAAVNEPADPGLLKRALSTELMGWRGEELEALLEDEEAWEEQVIRFRSYRDLWERQGFIRMFYGLLFDNRILSRAIGFENGERRVTNLLHLAEVLHQALIGRKLSMSGLLKWLAEQRSLMPSGNEEQPLRLESDDRSVKLVTVHKSKGLEYRIVFCPFLWDGSRIKERDEPLFFHDAQENQAILDLGSESRNQNRGLAEQEILAENIRLFYVAVTRARDRCYLVWGRFKEAETSAPAYLLHGAPSASAHELVDALAQKVGDLNDQSLWAALRRWADQSQGDLALQPLPDEAGRKLAPVERKKADLQCRSFNTAIEKQWRITSFSGLTAMTGPEIEQPDHDSIVSVKEESGTESKEIEELKPQGIFAFPKGARSGECLHKIFERLDFTERNPAIVHELVAGFLGSFGFEAVWEPVVEELIRKVLALNLGESGHPLELRHVSKTERLSELEFYFPLRPLSKQILMELFGKHTQREIQDGWPEHIGRLQFAPVEGYLRGFMDLVFRFHGRFYLVDWKSNHLGNCPEEYRREAVVKAMHEHFYILQYHLYTLALHQYLQSRFSGYEYEKHFGGVYYLFVRGMDPAMGKEYGVFYDRPKRELVEELRERLIYC